MDELDILKDEFVEAAEVAWDRARQDALKQGHPVIFEDEDGRYVLEQPDGKRFEIRFISGAPRDQNYEIVRELPAAAA
ncbi:MAG: hypothetical protein LAQ69_14970 [Acidobacteriia bacterium]|nr:hypothetical protein [Terriglobia bacterium]